MWLLWCELIAVISIFCTSAALAQGNPAGAAGEPGLSPGVQAYESGQGSCCGASHAHGLYWMDPRVPTRADLLCIHGLGLCAKGYEPFGKRMAQEGIATYAMDVRGFGPQSHAGKGDKLDLNETVADVRDVLETIHGRHPDRPIFLLGESMGGSIAIRTAALYPESMSGLICSAPAWRIYKQKRTALKGLLALFLPRGHRVNLAAAGVIRQATNKSALRQHWLSDPDHRLNLSGREAFAFFRFTRRTPKNAGEISRTPVLILQGLHDRLVKPSGVARLFNRLPVRDKELILDISAEHLILEEGQFSNQVANAVVSWIERVGSAGPGLQPSERVVLLNASHETDKEERTVRQLLSAAGVGAAQRQ